jgi:hypothetical protein
MKTIIDEIRFELKSRCDILCDLLQTCLINDKRNQNNRFKFNRFVKMKISIVVVCVHNALDYLDHAEVILFG